MQEHQRESAPFEIEEGRIGSFEIGFDLIATSFVYDLAAHRIANIGHAVASWIELAPHTVDAFTKNNLYHVDALAQNYNVQSLSGCSGANRDFLVVHKIVIALSSV